MEYSLNDIANLVNGCIVGSPSRVVEQIVYDSRMVFMPEKSIFVALATQNSNGHLFVKNAYDKGCRIFLVSESVEQREDASYIKVANTLLALQIWAKHNSALFSGIKIGITGSLGKTTVKEWLYEILQPTKRIYKSPKSFNSQLGVALSALMLEFDSEFAIFEAGISKPNEMVPLAEIIDPKIGIITNIAEPHQANFVSLEEKLQEKLHLFKNSELILYCNNDERIDKAIKSRYPNKITKTWGSNHLSDLVLESSEDGLLIVCENDKKHKIQIASGDAYHIENIMHCLLTCLSLNVSIDSIASRMQFLKPLPMRLEMKQGKHDILLINDSYSADFVSLKVALDYLDKVSGNQNRTLIISSFNDQNISIEKYLENLQSFTFHYNLKRLVLIGAVFLELTKQQLAVDFVVYANTEDFLKKKSAIDFEGEAILIKGARSFKLERIINAFQEKSHRTKLEINLTALRYNYNYFKGIIGSKAKIMVMLKALGYGAGSFELARMLQGLQVDYIAVAYIDEGLLLRKRGITLPIMVLSPDSEGFLNLIEYNLEPEIFSLGVLLELTEFIKTENVARKIKIHLNFDTGMHRLGFNEKDINEILDILLNNSNYVEVASVFTHFAASEDSKYDDFTKTQIEKFNSIVKILENALPYKFLKHVSNTGGSLRHKTAIFDMIRLGIGFYGVDPSNIFNNNIQLAFRWLTQVSQILFVPKGESVGYGRRWFAKRDSLIATIPIGYADGLSRAAGNERASVYYNGIEMPIVGSVCMDMAMVDATGLNLKEGDEIVVFENHEQLEKLCKAQNTIPYEVLATISSRVRRIYLEE